MKSSVRLGRLGGVEVGLHWSMAVMAGLVALVLAAAVLPSAVPDRPAAVYWAVAVPAALLFAMCVLAHELAHAVTARRRGMTVRSVVLWMLGGATELDGEAPTPRAELVIAVVGPLTSAACGVVLVAAAVAGDALGAPGVVTVALTWSAWMNLVLAVFNMLPGAPLDGGRVLRAMLWRRYGDRARADMAAGRAGRVLGIVLVAAGLLEFLAGGTTGLWLALVGWFLHTSAGNEIRARRLRTAVGDVPVGEVMTEHPDCGATWNTVGGFIDRVAADSRQTVFPVLDFTGAPMGAVTVEMLKAVPAGRRDAIPLGRIAARLPSTHLRNADAPVLDLLDLRPVAGELLAVVLDEGRLIGMVTVTDLTRAVRRSGLHHLAAGTPATGPNTPGFERTRHFLGG